jgi:ribosomal protein S16
MNSANGTKRIIQPRLVFSWEKGNQKLHVVIAASRRMRDALEQKGAFKPLVEMAGEPRKELTTLTKDIFLADVLLRGQAIAELVEQLKLPAGHDEKEVIGVIQAASELAQSHIFENLPTLAGAYNEIVDAAKFEVWKTSIKYRCGYNVLGSNPALGTALDGITTFREQETDSFVVSLALLEGRLFGGLKVE